MSAPKDITFNLQLYNWPEKLDGVDIFPVFLDICEMKGLEPDSAMLFQGGKDRLVQFQTAKKRLVDNKVRGISGIQLFQSYSGDPKNEWFWKSCLEIEDTGKDFCWIEIGVTKINEDIPEYFLPVIKKLLEVLTPRYGMCFPFPLRYDPSMYSTGVIYDRLPEPHAQRLEDWGNEGFRKGRFLTGKFRDLYEVNILSKTHMEIVIGSELFPAWVERIGAGSLEQLKPGVWCWIVPKGLHEEVRERMMTEGLLIVTV